MRRCLIAITAADDVNAFWQRLMATPSHGNAMETMREKLSRVVQLSVAGK